MHACAVKIVTASFKGVVRVYRVQERDYKADDLLIEQELESSVLQIAVGRFSS
jgi:hypothetical protein